MGKYIYLSLIILLGLFVSCDQTNSKKGTTTYKEVDESKVFPVSIQKEGEFSDLDAIRARARSIIDHRAVNGDKPMSMLTYGYWNPEYVFNAGKMSQENQYAGYWIKYEDDFTYTYGAFDDVMGAGRYHFRLEDSQLIMLDDDVDQEPKVWTANNNGEMMSYVGTHEFGVNNGMQMKMIPLDTRPKK